MGGTTGTPSPVRAGKPFLVFGAPQIADDEIDEVVASMRAAWLGTGPKVARFEDAFREYKGAANVAAVSSCTAALHLSLLAAGIGAGDEVIVPALTFCATVNAVIHTGATPVLADVEPGSMNIDTEDLRGRISPRTRAIVPVHFAGRPCDMDAIMRVADEHGLIVIEDCAHAIEGEYHGQPTGTIGHFGCFSFYATKNLTTGEGGMVVARRPEDADTVRILALHGMSRDAWKRFGDDGYRHYEVVASGFKYNMMDLQAAIGIHQLRRLEDNWRRRQQIWRRYSDALSSLPFDLPPPIEPGTRHAYHLFTVLARTDHGRSRDEMLGALTREGIGVGVHYLSIPEHAFYRDRFGWTVDAYPVARDIGRRTISIPLSARLVDEDVDDVIEGLRRAVL